MLGSFVVYFGLTLVLAGIGFVVRPIRMLWVGTRRRALGVFGAGVLAAGVGVVLPAEESRVEVAANRLDEFAPVWQFREFHELAVAAPPERVFEAVKKVTADEIALFHLLTWIRRGGRDLPEGVLDAPAGEPIIDVAIRGGFVALAEQAPREVVVGAVVVAPPSVKSPATAETFRDRLPPGFALATMNFLVRPDGSGGSIVSTETRVHANSPAVRRRFAAYWRIIYPGSALIRRMWLRAIARRARGFSP